MTFGASHNTHNTTPYNDTASHPIHSSALSMFPSDSQLETDEQVRRFELLRLAFFVLKLRKFEQEGREAQGLQAVQGKRVNTDYHLRCSLLRHVIFQQVVTLTHLNAREQALQLINTCRN